MDAAGHLALAEQLLANDGAASAATPGGPTAPKVWEAIGHAMMAIAIEAGVPHAPDQPQEQVPS